MPDRKVKLGLMTYTNEQGVAGCVGLQGETVKVHPDALARFDELNVDMGDPVVPERVGVDMLSPPTPEKPAKKTG